MVTDHAIFAAIYGIARGSIAFGFLLSGTNAATESIMPPEWQHMKFDLRNLRAIARRFGSRPLRRFPQLSVWAMAWYHYTRTVESISLLNYIPYRRDAAVRILESELGWRSYGRKHYESVFTKFYQAFILPTKFGIDKRKCHLSDLIMNGESDRESALAELRTPLYDPAELEVDTEYVCKKLGFTRAEFDAYLAALPVSHLAYPSYAPVARWLVRQHKRLRSNA